VAERPALPLARVVAEFEISRSTLRRRIEAGHFPGAFKDTAGRWLVPVDDLVATGVAGRKTWLAMGGHERAHEGGHDLAQPGSHPGQANESLVATERAQMERDLAHERAQVDKLSALLDAERAHNESLRTAMRMLERAPDTRTSGGQDADMPVIGERQTAERVVSAPARRQWLARFLNRP